MRKYVYKFVAIVIATLFTVQSNIVAQDTVSLFPSVTLQVQTGLNPLVDPYLFHKSLLEIPVKYIVSSIDDIGNFNLSLKPRMINGLEAVLNFDGRDKNGKYAEGTNWVVPCTLEDAGKKYKWSYEVVIGENGDVSLRKPQRDKVVREAGESAEKSSKWRFAADGKIIAPLSSIRQEEIKNILVFSGGDMMPKLGEHVMNLWPLVTGLYVKYPHAKIYVVCNFPDIFKQQMFEKRIEAISREEADKIFNDQAEKARFIEQKSIDAVFEISQGPNFMRRALNETKKTGKRPYIFEIYSASSRLSAVSGFLAPPLNENRFFDRDGKRFEIAGREKIIKAAAIPWYNPEERPVGEMAWKMKQAGGWRYSIAACRALGLHIRRETLFAARPTQEECVGAIKWLEGVYNDSMKGREAPAFDPMKKIILINVYAVTQSGIITPEMWAELIVGIMKEAKNSYLLFTRGGEMDLDPHYIRQIKELVDKKVAEAKKRGETIHDPAIILPRENIYPHIHSILSISSAVVTLDTGLSHLANGAYGIPTAVITTPSIPQWLPPRDNVSPVMGFNAFDLAADSLFWEYRDSDKYRQKMVDDIRGFMREVAATPERPEAEAAKFLAASLGETRKLDRELSAAHAFQYEDAEKDLRRFLAGILEKTGLPASLVPEKIKFVDSSAQLPVKVPRFDVKLFTAENGESILLVDKSVLTEHDGRKVIRDETKKVDILHEITGHMLARALFKDFNKTKDPKIVDSLGEPLFMPFIAFSMIYKTEEEIVAWVFTLFVIQNISKLDPDFLNEDLRKKIRSWGIDIGDEDITHNVKSVIEAVRNVNATSTLRYWRIIDRYRDNLEAAVYREYFPAMTKKMDAISENVERIRNRKATQEGLSDDGTVKKPLNMIEPASVKKILVYSGRKIFSSKLGETIIDLWPLVTGLLEKFPGAEIQIVTDFPDIFSPGMFSDRIKLVGAEDKERLHRIPEYRTDYLVQNGVDLVFDVSCTPGGFSYMKKEDFPDKRLPYVVELQSAVSLLGAFSPVLVSTANFNRFRDREGREYVIGGWNETILKHARPQTGVIGGAKPMEWILETAGGWKMSIDMCRALGLDVGEKSMMFVKPVPEETIGALKWLQEVYEESNPDKQFDPTKKVVLVNVYAVTQAGLLSEDEWSEMIVELINGIKNAYLVFTSGGEMDTDTDYVKRIVSRVREKMRKKAGIPVLEDNGTEIVMPRRNIYPYIHDLLTITSAVITLDTGLSHLASGVYNIPTAVITKKSILHWLPPRESAVPVITLKDINLESLFRGGYQVKDEDNIKILIKGIREFVAEFNMQPERESVRLAKFSASSISERIEFDRELVEKYSFECPSAKEDLKIFLESCLNFFKLPLSLVPEIVFVDSAAQTGVGIPRFKAKLFRPGENGTYLLVDKSAIRWIGQEKPVLGDEVKKFEIFHEVFGHMLVRRLFSEFVDIHMKAVTLPKNGNGRHDEYGSIMKKSAEEEVLAWVLTFAALAEIVKRERSFLDKELFERIKAVGSGVLDGDIAPHVGEIINWVEKEDVLSTLRYKSALMKYGDEIRDKIVKEYLARALDALRIPHGTGKDAAEPGSPSARNLANQEELITGLVENIVSLFNRKKVVLAFENGLGGADAALIRSVFSELEALRKDPQYERLLANLEVINGPSAGLVERIKDMSGKDGTVIFMFARKTERNKLAEIEGKTHAVYVNENGFPEEAYYPLAEIVTITLSEFLRPGTVDAVKGMLRDINIQEIGEEDSALVFMLLPKPEKFDTREELIKKYANLRRLLRAA